MASKEPELSWGHLNINVNDLERSIDFYRKLGFEMMMPGVPYLGITMEEARPVDAAGASALGLGEGVRGRACIMQLGPGFPKLDLTELGGEGRPPLESADRGLVRFCLATRNLKDTYASLTEAGVPFLSPPASCGDGRAEIAVCADPDGTLIELIEVHIERWATSD